MAEPVSVLALQAEVDAAAARAGPEPNFPHLELQRLLPTLREHQAVEPHPLLIGRTRYERLWVRINRLVRRVAAHAVEPAVAQQNEFNHATLDALEQLIEAERSLRAATAMLRARHAAPRHVDQPDAR